MFFRKALLVVAAAFVSSAAFANYNVTVVNNSSAQISCAIASFNGDPNNQDFNTQFWFHIPAGYRETFQMASYVHCSYSGTGDNPQSWLTRPQAQFCVLHRGGTQVMNADDQQSCYANGGMMVPFERVPQNGHFINVYDAGGNQPNPGQPFPGPTPNPED